MGFDEIMPAKSPTIRINGRDVGTISDIDIGYSEIRARFSALPAFETYKGIFEEHSNLVALLREEKFGTPEKMRWFRDEDAELNRIIDILEISIVEILISDFRLVGSDVCTFKLTLPTWE